MGGAICRRKCVNTIARELGRKMFPAAGVARETGLKQVLRGEAGSLAKPLRDICPIRARNLSFNDDRENHPGCPSPRLKIEAAVSNRAASRRFRCQRRLRASRLVPGPLEHRTNEPTNRRFTAARFPEVPLIARNTVSTRTTPA